MVTFRDYWHAKAWEVIAGLQSAMHPFGVRLVSHVDGLNDLASGPDNLVFEATWVTSDCTLREPVMIPFGESRFSQGDVAACIAWISFELRRNLYRN